MTRLGFTGYLQWRRENIAKIQINSIERIENVARSYDHQILWSPDLMDMEILGSKIRISVFHLKDNWNNMSTPCKIVHAGLNYNFI